MQQKHDIQYMTLGVNQYKEVGNETLIPRTSRLDHLDITEAFAHPEISSLSPAVSILARPHLCSRFRRLGEPLEFVDLLLLESFRAMSWSVGGDWLRLRGMLGMLGPLSSEVQGG